MEYLKTSLMNLKIDSKSRQQSIDKSVEKCSANIKCNNDLNVSNCDDPSIIHDVDTESPRMAQQKHGNLVKVVKKSNEHALRKSKSTPAFNVRDCNENKNSGHKTSNDGAIDEVAVEAVGENNLSYGCAHYKRRAMFVVSIVVLFLHII